MKTGRHRRDNGGHALRGRRKGQKTRAYMTLPTKKPAVKVKTAGHVEPERRLVFSSEDSGVY